LQVAPNRIPQKFPGESLNDGWAIMYFDGVLTAVDAVQALYTSDGAQQVPSAGAVAQQLNSLTVHGASGYICFNSEHDPVTKAIPVLQLGQNGQLTYVTLSSASGNSPDHDLCPS
jgi:ABC-type branched-subunit amino acid transport system substrate-binding protein